MPRDGKEIKRRGGADSAERRSKGNMRKFKRKPRDKVRVER